MLFAKVQTIDILNFVCWFFQCGAELHKYEGISDTMTEGQWLWVQDASKRFYVPRKLSYRVRESDRVWMKRKDPFVIGLVKGYPHKYRFGSPVPGIEAPATYHDPESDEGESESDEDYPFSASGRLHSDDSSSE